MNALSLQRLANRLQRAGVPAVPELLRRTIQVLFSSVLPPELSIGDGTQLGYGGLGVVIHGGATVGRCCLIAQQVTIGGRSGQLGAPSIGDFVLIGAGAKILGPIRIGDGAMIGANAVVLRDVAAGEVVVGVPARPVAVSDAARQAFRREMRRHFGVDVPLQAGGAAGAGEPVAGTEPSQGVSSDRPAAGGARSPDRASREETRLSCWLRPSGFA